MGTYIQVWETTLSQPCQPFSSITRLSDEFKSISLYIKKSLGEYTHELSFQKFVKHYSRKIDTQQNSSN